MYRYLYHTKKTMKDNVKNIKYVLWDIDGTLLDFDYAEVVSLKECFRNFNLGEFTDEQLEVYKKINSRYWKELEEGKITKKELVSARFKEFFPLYGINPDIAEEFNDAYQVAIGNHVYLIKNSEETLKAISEKYEQYGVTNGTTVAQTIKLEKSGLNKILKNTFISEEIGFEKPSIDYFNFVFGKIGSNNPEEYIIIGDSLTSDMQGGINSGIMTCWFNPAHKENNKNFTVDYEIYDLKDLLEILI